MATKNITVPDIGDFSDVPVIEIMVSPGDTIAREDPLIALESDKAMMEVPSPEAGIVRTVNVALNDTVSQGDVIVTIEPARDAKKTTGAKKAQQGDTPPAASSPSPSPSGDTAKPAASIDRAGADLHASLLVLGAGPGGYTAAFRAADLGRSVVLVDRWPALGGVCLNVGCIPSKALLHGARVIAEAQEMTAHGIAFGKPGTDIRKLAAWKDGVVSKLTSGLAGLASARKVNVIQGTGTFSGPHLMQVKTADGIKAVSFDQAIIAAGSEPIMPDFVPRGDKRVIDSTGALDLDSVPKRMLVIGGGIIGLEMATVYHALGAKITVVELMDQIIPGADKDIIRPLHRHIAERYEKIALRTKVVDIAAQKSALKVTMEGPEGEVSDRFDTILVAIGRMPLGTQIGAAQAGVAVDERGFIATDRQMRTNVPHIFAIGDIVGQPMLAHKAVHEGKVAAEVACDHKTAFDARVIPSVAYTDPEVAWAGVTEREAKAQGLDVAKGVFPWAASGRALSLGRSEGVTKLLFDKSSERVVGAGIVGLNAGDLIAEIALAIEMGADAHDVGLTIHPHPTLSETIAMAAEMFTGSITDLMPPKKR